MVIIPVELLHCLQIEVLRIPDVMYLLVNYDFSLAVSDFKIENVATRFKTDDYVICEIVVESESRASEYLLIPNASFSSFTTLQVH